MLSFLADENFHRRIVRGVLQRLPTADIVRVQDVGLAGIDDPGLLDWAAEHGRIILSHDMATLIGFAAERISLGLPMPGLLIVPRGAPFRLVIEDIVLATYCGESEDFVSKIAFLPLVKLGNNRD